MILTVDIGNSNIVLGGVREDNSIAFEARLRTEVTKTSDQYCVDLKILLDVYKVKYGYVILIIFYIIIHIVILNLI